MQIFILFICFMQKHNHHLGPPGRPCNPLHHMSARLHVKAWSPIIPVNLKNTEIKNQKSKPLAGEIKTPFGSTSTTFLQISLVT